MCPAPTSTPNQRSPMSCVSSGEAGGRGHESIASAPTTDHGNGSEREPAGARAGRCRSRRPVPGGATSATTLPPGASSWPDAAQQAHRVAADADVAVGEQHGLPPALGRHALEDVARIAATPRLARLPDRLGHDVDAQHDLARSASSWVIRPGPQPTSSVGPVQRSSTARSPSSVRRPAAYRRRSVEPGHVRQPATTHGRPRKTWANTALDRGLHVRTAADRAARRVGEGRVGGAHARRPARRRRRCRRRAAPAPPPDGEAGGSNSARGSSCVGRRASTSGPRRGLATRGSASAERPPAAVLGGGQHGVVRRRARRRPRPGRPRRPAGCPCRSARRGPAARRHVVVRAREPLGEARRRVCGEDGPAGERSGQPVGVHGRRSGRPRERARQSATPTVAAQVVQGVEQRGGRELGRDLEADRRRRDGSSPGRRRAPWR